MRRPLVCIATLTIGFISPSGGLGQQIEPAQEYALRFVAFRTILLVPDHPALDLGSEFTLEAWVRPDEALNPNWTFLVGRADGGSQEILLSVSETLRPRLNQTDQLNTPAEIEGPLPLPRHAWSHVAGVLRAGQLELWVNGSLVATGASPGPPPTSSVLDWSIGSTFSGTLAQVRVWDRAISPAEIAASAGTGEPTNTTGLVGWWPLDDAFEQTARDLGPNDIGLILGGAPWEDSEDPGWVRVDQLDRFQFERKVFDVAYGRVGVLADLDGDGDLDYVRFVVLDEAYLINTPPYYVEPPEQPIHAYRFDSAQEIYTHDPSLLPATPIQTVFAHRVAVADFDGDGRDDIFVTDTGPDPLPNPDPGQFPFPGGVSRLLRQKVTGGLEDRTGIDFQQIFAIPHGLAVGDIDGNDRPDILFGVNGWTEDTCEKASALQPEAPCPRFYINNGSGVLAPSLDHTPDEMIDFADGRPLAPHAAALGDLDNDGDLDLVVSPTLVHTLLSDLVFWNDGEGHWSAADEDALPHRPLDPAVQETLSIVVHDFNGDGYAEVIAGSYSNSGGPRLSYLYNLGNMTFEDRSYLLDDVLLDGRIDVGDIDRDGRPDFMVSGGFNARPAIFLQQPDGSFRRAGDIAPFPSGGSESWMADIDGDGNLDILSDAPGDTIEVFLSRPTVFSDGFESGDTSAWEENP